MAWTISSEQKDPELKCADHMRLDPYSDVQFICAGALLGNLKVIKSLFLLRFILRGQPLSFK